MEEATTEEMGDDNMGVGGGEGERRHGFTREAGINTVGLKVGVWETTWKPTRVANIDEGED